MLLGHTSTDLAPAWLLVAALLVAIGLTWTAARSSWPTPRLDPAGGRLLPTWTTPLLRVGTVLVAAAGLAVWALTLTAGLFADTEFLVDNLAPFVVNLQLLVLGMLAAVVLGDWWAAASPFTTLARVVPDRGTAGTGGAPAWTAPALLATFLWLVTCYHDNGDPVAIGIWLAAYTVAVLVGAAVWGWWWVATGEGFGALLGACARTSPFRRDTATARLAVRPPLAGLGGPLPAGSATACLLAASASVFLVVSRTDWWAVDVNGARSGWSATLVSTLGLAFTCGIAAIVTTAATRLRPPGPAPATSPPSAPTSPVIPTKRTASASPVTSPAPSATTSGSPAASHAAAAAAGAGLVPLAVGIAGAMLLTQGLARGIDALALLSDPYGRGWDLLGTADWFPDVRWDTSRRLAWTEHGLLLVGAVASVLVAHDGTLRTQRGRARAERALLPQLAAGSVLAVAALLVLIG